MPSARFDQRGDNSWVNDSGRETTRLVASPRDRRDMQNSRRDAPADPGFCDAGAVRGRVRARSACAPERRLGLHHRSRVLRRQGFRLVSCRSPPSNLSLLARQTATSRRSRSGFRERKRDKAKIKAGTPRRCRQPGSTSATNALHAPNRISSLARLSVGYRSGGAIRDGAAPSKTSHSKILA